MKQKNVLQNTLLTRINPEDRAKAIINELRALPNHIEDIEQIDYKKLLPVMVVRKRDDLIFIVGDKGVEKIKDFKSIKPIFKGKHPYQPYDIIQLTCPGFGVHITVRTAFLVEKGPSFLKNTLTGIKVFSFSIK